MGASTGEVAVGSFGVGRGGGDRFVARLVSLVDRDRVVKGRQVLCIVERMLGDCIAGGSEPDLPSKGPPEVKLLIG